MDNRHEIAVFENDELGKVRVFTRGDEPWFAAKDVTAILGYTNASKAITDHVDEEDKLNNETLSSLGQRGGWLINESGLYSLILSSKLPTARKFKRWVTAEILPCIRRNGAYMTDSILDQVMQKPELVLAMAEKLLRERADNDGMRLELSVTRPKAEYYDAFIHPEDCTNIRVTAKELQVSERWFCRFYSKPVSCTAAPPEHLCRTTIPKTLGCFA